MEETVQRHELLYRVIKRSQPDSMDEKGRPTSALFKQDNGVSVDRDGDRDEKIIIKTFKERSIKDLRDWLKLKLTYVLITISLLFLKPHLIFIMQKFSKMKTKFHWGN